MQSRVRRFRIGRQCGRAARLGLGKGERDLGEQLLEDSHWTYGRRAVERGVRAIE
jgi:hypothetical protein